jgi:hypothetical protein
MYTFISSFIYLFSQQLYSPPGQLAMCSILERPGQMKDIAFYVLRVYNVMEKETKEVAWMNAWEFTIYDQVSNFCQDTPKKIVYPSDLEQFKKMRAQKTGFHIQFEKPPTTQDWGLPSCTGHPVMTEPGLFSCVYSYSFQNLGSICCSGVQPLPNFLATCLQAWRDWLQGYLLPAEGGLFLQELSYPQFV